MGHKVQKTCPLDLAGQSQLLRCDDTVTGSLTIHAPDLHLTVICPRHNKGHSGMEGSPVYSTIMTLWEKDVVFENCFIIITQSKSIDHAGNHKRHFWLLLLLWKDSRDYAALRLNMRVTCQSIQYYSNSHGNSQIQLYLHLGYTALFFYLST